MRKKIVISILYFLLFKFFLHMRDKLRSIASLAPHLPSDSWIEKKILFLV